MEEQLRALLSRQVPLRSGGNLIFDRTEALTVIDVNSSKYTGNSTLQDTIFHVNKEAAVEIARQLRLRDIGGIIIIDFIDMVQANQRKEILDILERETAKDNTKTHVMGMTALNLVEITRKNHAKDYIRSNSVLVMSAVVPDICIHLKRWLYRLFASCGIWFLLITSKGIFSSVVIPM